MNDTQWKVQAELEALLFKDVLSELERERLVELRDLLSAA